MAEEEVEEKEKEKRSTDSNEMSKVGTFFRNTSATPNGVFLIEMFDRLNSPANNNTSILKKFILALRKRTKNWHNRIYSRYEEIARLTGEIENLKSNANMIELENNMSTLIKEMEILQREINRLDDEIKSCRENLNMHEERLTILSSPEYYENLLNVQETSLLKEIEYEIISAEKQYLENRARLIDELSGIENSEQTSNTMLIHS